MEKLNWKGINYPTKTYHWKVFAKNNPTIALDILYIKDKEICSAYISEHNSTHEEQIMLLIIPNEQKEGRWHYLW